MLLAHVYPALGEAPLPELAQPEDTKPVIPSPPRTPFVSLLNSGF